MCGFCGEIRFDGSQPDVEQLQAMNAVMVPRGPDAGGLLQMKHIAVAHRRLKIIDLSEHAQQPMVDNELGLGIVFNGCIYNYRELRAELRALGYRFFSEGDTEVILKSYHAWGTGCVDRFHGMFAFAIWERDSGRLILARDRLGIKPLYLAESENGVRFASALPALPALLAGGGIDTSIDPVALHHYMSFHAVVPAPYTLLNGVRKLPPATVRTIEADGRSQDRRYWSLRFETTREEAELSYEDWQERTLDALRKAVERRLVADVPVGVLLSGGLDSSLIVGLLAEQGQHGLSTFSVGFEEAGGEKGDEFEYSDIIARHFDTDHHKIFVDSARLLPALEHCVTAMSEPMVSHDVIGFYLLSKEVSKHVKVVQSGQGADEVFGGYHWYPPLVDAEDTVASYASVFFDRDHAEYRQVIHPDLLGDDYSREFVQRHFAMPGARQSIDRALRLDTTIMLVDDPVKAVIDAGVELPVDCHPLFTISEEVGSGASAILHGDISEMLTLDNGTTAPGQNSREYGVTICMADMSGPFDYHLTHRILQLCQEFEIPHQRDVFRYYRSDSAAAVEAGNDLRTALATFGIDASHGWERIHWNALDSLAQLVALYMQSPPLYDRDREERGPLVGFSTMPG